MHMDRRTDSHELTDPLPITDTIDSFMTVTSITDMTDSFVAVTLFVTTFWYLPYIRIYLTDCHVYGFIQDYAQLTSTDRCVIGSSYSTMTNFELLNITDEHLEAYRALFIYYIHDTYIL